MAEIIGTFTQSVVHFHIKKDFQLGLTKPRKANLEQFEAEFNVRDLKVDDDNDIEVEGGSWSNAPNLVLRKLNLWLSRERLTIQCLRATSEECTDLMYRALKVLYGVSVDQVNAGVEYVLFETTTKVRFDNDLEHLFSKEMRDFLYDLSDLSSGWVLSAVSDGNWHEHAGSMINVEDEKCEFLYGGKQQALVIPSNLKFSIWVPSNFNNMTNYSVSLACNSVEDYHQNLYFVQTELPYEQHARLIQVLDRCKDGG